MFKEVEAMTDSSETSSNAAKQQLETARERVERLFRTNPQLCLKPTGYIIRADRKPELPERD
jgi:hypothetical protein